MSAAPPCSGMADQVRNNRYSHDDEYSPSGPGWRVDGDGPLRLTLSHTVTVSNTYRSEVGISEGAVSAKLGWDVSRSWSTGTSAIFDVPAGKHGILWAGQARNVHSFEVWRVAYTGGKCVYQKRGTGYAWKFNHLNYHHN